MLSKKSTKENLLEFLDSDSGYATVTKVILATIGLAGIFFIAATAPNIFQIFGTSKKGGKYSNSQYKNAFYSLKRRGFVKVTKEKDDKIRVELTNSGKKKIREFFIENISIPKPGKWDKKWRVVIFDIPSKFHKIKFNKAREALRSKLKELGFFQLQKSVWVYPYPCADEMLFIVNIFEVEHCIEILTVEKMLHDSKLKYFFGL
jgi:DNA-binding transcriptional regulator PaaX